MKNILFVLALILSGNAFASCDSTTALIGANFGFYSYDAVNNRWLLVDSFYEDHAVSEPMRSGDEYRPLSLYQPSPGGGGGGGQQQQSVGARQATTLGCDPIVLPPVEVVGIRPVSTSYVIMLRYIPINFGGGTGSFNRQSVGGTRQADNRLTCQNSSDTERGLAALRALPPIVSAQSVWMIRYASGHHQMWVVTAPLFTDRGLLPFGRCVGG